MKKLDTVTSRLMPSPFSITGRYFDLKKSGRGGA
jgi:hypothetical protein